MKALALLLVASTAAAEPVLIVPPDAGARILKLDEPTPEWLEPPLKRRVVPYVAVTAGALAIGAIVATAFALSADSHASRIERERETSGITADEYVDYRGTIHSRDRDADLAWGLGVSAVALGLAALGLGVL